MSSKKGKTMTTIIVTRDKSGAYCIWHKDYDLFMSNGDWGVRETLELPTLLRVYPSVIELLGIPEIEPGTKQTYNVRWESE